MKNEHLPLIQALKKRSKAPFFSDPERIFELKKGDFLNLQKQPGDMIRVSLHGKVKSLQDDGSMQMSVHKVDHQSEGTDVQDAPEAKVRTQESHSP